MNTQQKLEKVIRTARKELTKLKEKQPSNIKDGVEALNSYLESKKIAKAFGKSIVVTVKDAGIYTRKNGTTTPLSIATTDKGVMWNVTPERFWMKKE